MVSYDYISKMVGYLLAIGTACPSRAPDLYSVLIRRFWSISTKFMLESLMTIMPHLSIF